MDNFGDTYGEEFDDAAGDADEVDNWDQLMFAVDADVERVGWHATGVFPTVESPSTQFLYTTGLDPEFIVLGLPPEVAHAIVSDIIESGDFSEGIRSDLLQNGLPCRLEEHAEFKGVMSVTNFWRPEREYKVIQVLWPDTQGNLPGDSKCDPKYADMQSLEAIQ